MTDEDARFTSALGHIAQQSSLLEAVVAVALWGLVGIEQQVARIVLPNDTRRMTQLIDKLLPLRVPADQDLRDDVAAWATEVRAAHGRRSRVLHALWGDDGEPGFLRADIRPMKDTTPFERYTLSDLHRLAEQLQQLTFAGAELAERLAAALPGPWALGNDAAGGRGAIRFARED